MSRGGLSVGIHGLSQAVLNVPNGIVKVKFIPGRSAPFFFLLFCLFVRARVATVRPAIYDAGGGRCRHLAVLHLWHRGRILSLIVVVVVVVVVSNEQASAVPAAGVDIRKMRTGHVHAAGTRRGRR